MAKRDPFKCFKTSPEIIRLVVMMYVRFPLSLRDVEDLLHERGIDICHETIRFWWNKFGPIFTAEIRRKRVYKMHSHSNWQWYLDEVFVKINGETHYLWQAVDHEGEVLDCFVSKRRNRVAALKFLRKLMKRYGPPEIVVTDRLRFYGAAMKVIGNADRQMTGRWLNNRAENSHLPFRRRKRAILRFRQMRSLQKFTAIHSSVHNHFNLERHLYSRSNFKRNRTRSFRMAATLFRIGSRILRQTEAGSNLSDRIRKHILSSLKTKHSIAQWTWTQIRRDSVARLACRTTPLEEFESRLSMDPLVSSRYYN